MVVCVPRGEEADPVPASQCDVVAIGHTVRGAGRFEPLVQVGLVSEHSRSHLWWWSDS